MLVCAGNFAHFGRLTDLVGLGLLDVDARHTSANVQFFTEYGFSESVIGEARVRFPRRADEGGHARRAYPLAF